MSKLSLKCCLEGSQALQVVLNSLLISLETVFHASDYVLIMYFLAKVKRQKIMLLPSLIFRLKKKKNQKQPLLFCLYNCLEAICYQQIKIKNINFSPVLRHVYGRPSISQALCRVSRIPFKKNSRLLPSMKLMKETSKSVKNNSTWFCKIQVCMEYCGNLKRCVARQGSEEGLLIR